MALPKIVWYFSETDIINNITINDYSTLLYDPLLDIWNLLITRSKDRPMNSLSQSLIDERGHQGERQRAFENPIVRRISGFEYAEGIDLTEFIHFDQPAIVTPLSNQALENVGRLFLK